MAVDTATTISALDVAAPASGDPKSEGDDNFRHIKTVVKNAFPNVAGAVTATHTELNYVDGVTSAIQTQFTAKANLASPTFTGVPAAPTAAGGTNTTQVATCEFVTASSFASVLPAQTGNSGKFVTTDGTNASWLGLADVTVNGVGTYILAYNLSGASSIGAGVTTAGSNLRAISFTAVPALVSGATLSGTWRAMSVCVLNDATLFQRTA